MNVLATFPVKVFQAAALFAPDSDIRYYLNGVHLERCASGEFHIVSTDGRALFVHRLFAECEQVGPWSLIIPISTLTAFLKSKPKLFQLLALEDGRYALSDGCGFTIQFVPTDGKFPDWRRVLPSQVSGESAQYRSDLLARAQKALGLIDGVRTASTTLHGQLHQNGPGAAVYVGKSSETAVVVMPYRNPDKAPMSSGWLSPTPYEAAKIAA